MIAVAGSNTALRGGTFRGAFPIRLMDQSADCLIADTRFEVGHWSRSVILAQLYGDRRTEAWSEAQAIRRAKDEVLQALLDVHQSAKRDLDLGTWLEVFKDRTVLLLGDFNHGRERLETLRDLLAAQGYEVVLLDEVPEMSAYDLPQKFQAVASVCRFLAFDDTTPAGQIYELGLADSLKSIQVVLREKGRRSSFMTVGRDLTSKNVAEYDYDAESLPTVITDAVAWAESRVRVLEQGRSSIYPWRDASSDSSGV